MEAQVWKIINKEKDNEQRKKREKISEKIETEEWDRYFRVMGGGVEWRVMRGERRWRGREEMKKRR